MAREDGWKNLIPTTALTEKERREMGSRGGKASVEARRKKKTWKEVAEYIAYGLKIPKAVRDRLKKEGFDTEYFSHMAVATRSIMAKAEQGDVAAYNALIAIMGQKPKEEVTATVDMCLRVEMVETGMKLAEDENEIEDESK